MASAGEGIPRLLTIPISHYCEKARWALELAGVDYREERHLQLIHRLYSWRAGGSGKVPVLVAAEETLTESSEIVRWAGARLPPERSLYPEGLAGEVAA